MINCSRNAEGRAWWRSRKQRVYSRLRMSACEMNVRKVDAEKAGPMLRNWLIVPFWNVRGVALTAWIRCSVRK